MKKSLLTIGAVCMATAAALAQNPGDLDVNFGIGGYTLTDPLANTGEKYWDLKTLSDDKIIKVGYTNLANKDLIVAKFLADGTPDSTFALNGFYMADLSLGGDEEARGVYELANGQLLVTGYVEVVGGYDGYIMRLNADGTLDNSFGAINGYTRFNTGDNTIAYGKDVIEIGGEIYVGGSVMIGGQGDICVFNFTFGGGLDLSFASSGSGTWDINGGDDIVTSMDMTSGGAFILGGTSDSSGVTLGFVSSLSQFGTPSSFAGDGSFTFDMFGTNEVNDLIVDANDKIVFVGDGGTFPDVDGFIMRLNNDGSVDNTFATNGIAMSDPGVSTALFLRSVNQTADGGYVAVGNFDGASQDIYALMVTATGSFNSNFGGNGDVIIPFAIATNTVQVVGGALQSDGSIIIGGHLTSQDFVGENMFMVRLYPYDNASVSELTEQVVTVYPNPATDNFTIQMENVQNVQMISMQGEFVGSWSSQMSYDVPQGVTPGIYLLKIEAENSVGVARISIK